MTIVPVRKTDKPLGGLTRLHDQMDDLVSNFFEGWEMPFWGHRHWPAVDMEEKENEFLVTTEIPGCRAEDVDISVSGNVLTIAGEKKQHEEKKEGSYYHSERCFGSFRRELMLTNEVDAGKIEAVCKDGVLSVRLPKTEKTKPIKVRIKEE